MTSECMRLCFASSPLPSWPQGVILSPFHQHLHRQDTFGLSRHLPNQYHFSIVFLSLLEFLAYNQSCIVLVWRKPAWNLLPSHFVAHIPTMGNHGKVLLNDSRSQRSSNVRPEDVLFPQVGLRVCRSLMVMPSCRNLCRSHPRRWKRDPALTSEPLFAPVKFL